MGTEDWILKGIKLITNTKKQRLKNLEQRLDSQKYNIKNTKQNQSQFALKIGSFLQGNSRL